jgi:hypothetical protein
MGSTLCGVPLKASGLAAAMNELIEQKRRSQASKVVNIKRD